mgnify:CR=1 FL=1
MAVDLLVVAQSARIKLPAAKSFHFTVSAVMFAAEYTLGFILEIFNLNTCKSSFFMVLNLRYTIKMC